MKHIEIHPKRIPGNLITVRLPFLSLLAILLFTGCPTPKAPTFKLIDLEVAHKYYSEYSKTWDTTATGTIRGWTITIGQYDAMCTLFESSDIAASCRLYFGLGEDGDERSVIVCGVTEDNTDLTDVIYITPQLFAGLCPPICDMASPIIERSTEDPEASIPGDRISINQAQALHSKYMSAALESSGTISGIKISKEQFEAMTAILSDYPETSGFRLYLGSFSSDGDNLMFLCAIDLSGNDLTKIIIATSILNSGLCPPYCDSASPIMTGEL